MAKARRLKHLFGGAMRQAGIVAAAGAYALEHNVVRLAEDHASARRLAEGLAGAGLPVDPAEVETNFVLLDAAELGLSVEDAASRLARGGRAPLRGGPARLAPRVDPSRRLAGRRRTCDRGRRESVCEESGRRRLAQASRPLEATRARVRPCVCAWSSSWTSQAWPKSLIASMIGRSAAPFAVSSYSTRGGDSG